MKFLIISSYALQGITLSFIFFLHPKVRKMFKSFRKQGSANGSDASLASRSSIRKGKNLKPINSWNDFVIQARSSICEGNFHTTEPQTAVSSSPDPTDNRLSLILQPPRRLQNVHQDTKRRHTIRDIMQLAKSNSPKHPTAVPTVAKCITPPLPKVIPNQILDDVQLFDFYYKNLNSIFIQEIPQNPQTSYRDTTTRSQDVNQKFDELLNAKKFKNIVDHDERNDECK